VKFLIIDHHFWQDIEAFSSVANEHEIKVVSAFLIARIARKHFPASVFTSLLGKDYARPEYAKARLGYTAEARAFLHDLYYTFPFDVVIVPSDTIVYLRALVPCAHEMGIPFIVLQKETAISPYTMSEEARVIGQALPFISDLMLVCSEHHKQFWLNAGTKAETIIVTGQPRFDFYQQPERWKTLESLGVNFPTNRPVILFFSYDVGAYSPEGVLTPTWIQLRTETEETLINLARLEGFNVLIKPHPQQQGLQGMKNRLQSAAGSLWGKAVQLVPGQLDTRQLIINAQTVVGFQTTAIFEAMAAGKKVVYTFWTEATSRFANALLPFHELSSVLCVARSPQEFEGTLLSDEGTLMDEEQCRLRKEEAEKQLGPLDGKAAERCVKIIETYAMEYSRQVGTDILGYRQSLDMLAPAFCRCALPKAQMQAVIWYIARWAFPLVYWVWLGARSLLRGRTAPHGTYEHYRLMVAERYRNALKTIERYRAVLSRLS
jgi:hypothetical protein